MRWLLAFLIALSLTARQHVFAQADEIQVYDGGLAPVGTFNLTLHSNFTPKGQVIPAFPGAVVADKSLNGVPEFALGITPWFEAGLYLPLYSRDNTSGWGLDGFKLRTLFAVPHAGRRRFVYGANVEFSYNARRWDRKRFTSEIRPIVGWHLAPIDIIINPILDTGYDGLKNLVFAPSTRISYTVRPGWAVAVEEYADYGALRHFHSADEQSHQLYAVIDANVRGWDVEAGVGGGLTDNSDRLTVKLIIARDLVTFWKP